MQIEDLKSLFKENEWALIEEVLATKRINTQGKKVTWFSLAQKYNIRPEGDNTQRMKSANDVFRRYKRRSRGCVSMSNTASSISPKILIYDVETSRITANLWWSGKQYVGGSQITSETKIITVAFKWLGSNKVHYLKWDKNQCDKELMREFLTYYNQADMVIGYNSDRFDNKIINARALKFNFDVNLYVKSLDLMKQAKSKFRLPGYSMNVLAKFLGVQTKMQHSGLSMWEAIQYGNKKEAKKAMKMMIKYNVQDIIVTEQVYLRLRKYLKSPIHIGVLEGEGRTSCPICGNSNVKLHKTTTTSAGSIRRIMKCKDDGVTYQISNREYLKWMENNG